MKQFSTARTPQENGVVEIHNQTLVEAARTMLIFSRFRIVVQIVLWIVDSGCSKHMTGDQSLLKNFIEKFMGTVRFGNDNFTAITGYGDYIQGNITICHVYYVEGLGHNLFSIGQFCDGDLEVAFRSKTCYVRNLEGDDLLIGGHESNLYTISISDMAASSPVCLMSKATSTKSCLNMEKITFVLLMKEEKAIKPRIHLNYFLHSKDETLEIIKKFIAQAQLNYKAKVCKIRTDNGTKFKNATLKAHYEKLDLSSTSSIIVEEHLAPPIETTSDEQTSLISLTNADEVNQEDYADFNGNLDFVPYNTSSHEEIESSTAAIEPSNV
ncbi:integrase, catalytic region, zinc finger, CCHC-type containing protein [Tanacetum coccineum]